MALIDLSNFDSATLGLVQSTVGRAGTPNGNIFFDVANGRIELITATDAPTINMTSRGGSASEANPLLEIDGVKLEALYAFEREQRRSDEVLRQYDYFFKGTFKFGGAYELVNGRKFDDLNGSAAGTVSDDRKTIRGSGWIERDAAGAIGRIYYGVVSLGNIESASQPYYQLADGAAPVDFAKLGPINESIQVLGNISVDSNTTTFDTRTFLSNRIRTYGFNPDEKVLGDSGVTQMDGYSSGFALGETPHLTTVPATYPLADVYTTPIAPWSGMTLEKLAVAQTETGFTTADGNFIWVLNNTAPGNLDECLAFIDALQQTDDDIDTGAETITNGKRVGVWYTYDADGTIRFNAPFASEGFFVEQLVGTDKNRVAFVDDADASKLYPAFSNVLVTVGADAVSDVNAWFHAFFLAGIGAQAGNDFNTANAITVQDASATAVKGDVDGTGKSVGNNISFEFDWAADTVGGTLATNKDCVFQCEGDGGVTAAKTIFSLTNSASISATCQPLVETNV
jgi:hypothetical protein